MKIFVQNTLHGLIPLFPSDFDSKRKLKIGETYECEIKNPRNIGFHRRFFALINLAHENCSLDMPIDAFRRYLTIKAGYFDAYDTPKGVFYDAKSISFGSMSQDEFENLYSRVLDKVIELIGSTESDIEKELINFM